MFSDFKWKSKIQILQPQIFCICIFKFYIHHFKLIYRYICIHYTHVYTCRYECALQLSIVRRFPPIQSPKINRILLIKHIQMLPHRRLNEISKIYIHTFVHVCMDFTKFHTHTPQPPSSPAQKVDSMQMALGLHAWLILFLGRSIRLCEFC